MDDKNNLDRQTQLVTCWQLILEEVDRVELEVAEELRKRERSMVARTPAKLSLMMLRATHDQEVSWVDGFVLNTSPKRRMCPFFKVWCNFHGVVVVGRSGLKTGGNPWSNRTTAVFLRIQVT